MNYAYDCEFHERGHAFGLDLISIAIVAEDGRELYRVSTEFDLDAAWKNAWLQKNVILNLPYARAPKVDKEGVVSFKVDPEVWKPRDAIRADIEAFLADDPRPILWANFGAYDHVVLCQLWGAMIDLPSKMPRYTRDLKQECDRLGVKRGELPEQEGTEHDAREDALWDMAVWRYLTDRELRKDKPDPR